MEQIGEWPGQLEALFERMGPVFPSRRRRDRLTHYADGFVGSGQYGRRSSRNSGRSTDEVVSPSDQGAADGQSSL
jgi:hypothetical protein